MSFRRVELVGTTVLLAVLVLARPSLAQDDEALSPRPLRTAANLGAFLALDFGLLYLTPPPGGDPPGNVSLGDKLTFKAWSFDASAFPTNFFAHPMAGTFYYTTARSNRYGPLQSLGWAAASSLAWELIEFPENVSFNDLVVTPVAGASIGESLVQLSEWLARKSGSHGFWSSALFPMRLVNGGPRGENGDDDRMAAHVRLISGGTLHSGAELGMSLGTRLVHLQGFGASGQDTRFSIGGNVTSLSLETRGAKEGLSDLRFAAGAGMLSFYHRNLGVDGRGWDFLASA